MLHEPSKTYKPFQYQWAFDITQTHEIELHWHEKEVNLQQDIQQWKDGTLTDEEKDFITNVLRLFTQSDVAVGETYKTVFLPYFKNNEVSNMLTSFASREGVHQRAYALIPESLGLPESEWHAFLEYASMKNKWDMMTDRKSNSASDIAYMLAKTVFMEGVSLFGSFAMLLKFKQQAKMLGMCEVVEWSIRDESVHVEANARLFREFCAEHPRIVTDEFKSGIYDLARQVVRLEDSFIREVHRGTGGTASGSPGDGQSDIKDFIRYLADRRLIQLGLKGNFKVKEVPESMVWFEEITLSPRESNFFERRVTDYVDQGMEGTMEWGEYDRLTAGQA